MKPGTTEALGNVFDPRAVIPGSIPADDLELLERRARLLGPAYRLFYERPLHIVRGEGVWLWDSTGRRYLDAYNNVPSVGHSHPRVVAAQAAQAATLNTHTRYLHRGILDYAERLTATLPPEVRQMMFVCTGSEANDLALRIAEAATGGRGVVVTRFAYHGTTRAVAEVSPCLGEGNPIGAHVRCVEPPDTLRCPDAAGAFARAVADAFDDLRAAGHRPSALLVDTVFTSDGNFIAPGLLAPAVEAARRAGALFIADEVQPGFGRTGAHFWGFSRDNLVPDIVTMGKPMGNGHPIGALAARPEYIAAFAAQSRYFNTFGGNPVSIAAANAVLDVLEEERLQENAAVVGRHLVDGFLRLKERHACIADVRGAGLALAVEMGGDDGPEIAGRVVNGLKDRGILLSISGWRKRVLKIRPPLCFSKENAETLLEATGEVLEQDRYRSGT